MNAANNTTLSPSTPNRSPKTMTGHKTITKPEDQEQPRVKGLDATFCSAVPEDVAREIRDTWKAAREAGGEMQAFRIIERMVDRLGYGRTENNPPLLPNAVVDEIADMLKSGKNKE